MAHDSRFAQNLAIVLRNLNVSGVELAAALRVDKSVVRRWVLGSTRPSAVNLARLSTWIAGRVPGFSVAEWDRDAAGFAQLFLQRPTASARGEVATAPGPAFRAFAAFRAAIDREAPIYAGFWMTYVMDSGGGGKLIARAGRVWRDGQSMRIRLSGGEFEIDGEVFMGPGRVFILTDAPRAPALGLHILTGSARATPDLMVGVAAFVARDGQQSPAAAPLVAEFRSRFCGDAARDERTWHDLVEAARAIRTAADAARLLSRILHALSFRVIPPGSNGDGEAVMRVPAGLAGS